MSSRVTQHVDGSTWSDTFSFFNDAGLCQGAAALEILHAASGEKDAAHQTAASSAAFNRVLVPLPCVQLPYNLTALRLAQDWCVGRRRPPPCSGPAAATACSLCCTAYQRCAGVGVMHTKAHQYKNDNALHRLAAGCAETGLPVHTASVTSAALTNNYTRSLCRCGSPRQWAPCSLPGR